MMTTAIRNSGTAAPGTGGARAVRRPAPGLVRQFVGFVAVGLTTTAAYLALHAMLTDTLGTQLANVAAMAATTMAGTALNGMVSFPGARTSGPVGDQVRGLLTFALGALLSGWGLALLDAASVPDTSVLYYTVMVGLMGLSGLLRFVLLRNWVFAERPASVLAAA